MSRPDINVFRRDFRLLGSPGAAMAMINAYDAAIKVHHGENYDSSKFRIEVSEAAIKTSEQIRADLIKNPKEACVDYGDTGAARGLLRRY